MEISLYSPIGLEDGDSSRWRGDKGGVRGGACFYACLTLCCYSRVYIISISIVGLVVCVIDDVFVLYLLV